MILSQVMGFRGILVSVIDGDSVRVRRETDDMLVKVRIAGLDVPSRGAFADAAKKHILLWVGRRVLVGDGCCGSPHGEFPAIVKDDNGHNLGKELLLYGTRLSKFPIEQGVLPNVSFETKCCR